MRVCAAGQAASGAADTDGDGLSDGLEQSLLVQFEPTFMIDRHDCSKVPGEFRPDSVAPLVKAENGTIYGQVTPAKDSTKARPLVEIHYFHLWREDCGEHAHPLDTEHVSALVEASGSSLSSATWKAVYWYAAAHENTVCDVSQIARASTVKAETGGARVWVSAGKHASYLNPALCRTCGCGADHCEDARVLKSSKLINLGEPGRPMDGSVFTASRAWPLAGKMETTNFPANPLARLDALPASDIAWFHAGRHPVQGIVSISDSTEGALAQSGRNTTEAMSVAQDSTGNAVQSAGDSTGNALQKSYGKTVHALGTSARHVGRALGMKPEGTGHPE